MMTGIFEAILAVLLVGTASAADQTPCCYPKQFTARLETIDSHLEDGKIVTIEGDTEMAYDATNERVAEITDAYNDVTGVYEKTKFIYDYPKHKTYIIQGQKCTIKTLPYAFSAMCIPPIAKFVETVPIGLGEAFPASSFAFVMPSSTPSYNLLVRFSVGAEGCIPYQLGIFATQKTAPSGQAPSPVTTPTDPLYKWVTPSAGAIQQLTSAYQYSDYREGIDDPSSWFDPPSGCVPGSHGAQGDVAKRAPTLKRVLAPRGRKFKVY